MSKIWELLHLIQGEVTDFPSGLPAIWAQCVCYPPSLLEFASRLTVRAESRAVARVSLRGIRQKAHVTLLQYSEFWY